MTPDTIETLFKVLGPVAVIWLTWVTVSHWKTKQELDALKLYVAQNYAEKEVVNRIFLKLDELSGIVHTIAGILRVTSKE